MVKIVEARWEPQRHNDPESIPGIEERIYFPDSYAALSRMAEVIDAANAAHMYDIYVCYRYRNDYREMIRVVAPAKGIVTKLRAWENKMKFELVNDVQLYLAARPRFDQEKLMLLLMKASQGAFDES